MEKVKLIKLECAYKLLASGRVQYPSVLTSKILDISPSVDCLDHFSNSQNPIEYIHCYFEIVCSDFILSVYGDIDDLADCINTDKDLVTSKQDQYNNILCRN